MESNWKRFYFKTESNLLHIVDFRFKLQMLGINLKYMKEDLEHLASVICDKSNKIYINTA